MQKQSNLNDLALALASAKKPCPDCTGADPHQHCTTNSEYAPCKTCKGTGEVYLLGPEIRVECLMALPLGMTASCSKAKGICPVCNNRRWNPLDPKLLGDWMVALAKVGYAIRLIPPSPSIQGDPWTAICGRHPKEWFASTPELATYAAANYSLSLDKVTAS